MMEEKLSTKRSFLTYDCDENDPNSLQDNIYNLNEKIESLQQQVSVLQDNQNLNYIKYNNVKSDNATLLNRIRTLEEQLREMEIASGLKRSEDERRFKSMMERLEREKTHELDSYVNRIYDLQQEIISYKSDLLKASATIERLESEKCALVGQLELKNEVCESLREDVEKYREMTRLVRAEEKTNLKLIAALSEKLDDLSSSELRNGNINDDVTLSTLESENSIRMEDWQEEMDKLRKENEKLREINQDLQEQLLVLQLDKGRDLVEEMSGSSLAGELNDLSMETLNKSLQEQKECNKKLRAYIDGILLNIVDNYPQLLEVKRKH